MASQDDPNRPSPWETPIGGVTPPASDPWTADDLAAAEQWADAYITQHQIPGSWGNRDDLLNTYRAQRKQGVSHDQALATIPHMLGWDVDGVKPPPPPPPPPPKPPDIFNAPLTKPFGETFAGPTPGPLFAAPPYTTPPAFKDPSAEEALQSPGYLFRRDQGRQSLQNWAAARGTLNDSGTANALEEYGQNAASQEYANVWNRAYNAYNTNYKTQFTDPYALRYQGASDAFAASEHRNDVNYLNSWNEFLNRQNYYSNWQDRTFNKQFNLATA